MTRTSTSATSAMTSGCAGRTSSPSCAARASPAAAEDRRALEAARVGDQREEPTRGEDRVAALHNYRRARGLCFKCGERWAHGHQCAAMVQRHVVEELLELLQAEAPDHRGVDSNSDEDQLMSISKLAATGETTPRTVRLLGKIGDLEVLVLVDSGSSHSVAAKMQSQVLQMAPMAVKIADGGTLSCFRLHSSLYMGDTATHFRH